MKKAIVVLFVSGLFFASCEKPEVTNDEKFEQKLIEKDGIETAADNK